jgi:hypothetical protein
LPGLVLVKFFYAPLEKYHPQTFLITDRIPLSYRHFIADLPGSDAANNL